MALTYFPTADAVTHQSLQPVPLGGAWRMALDRGDTGVAERWFEKRLEGRIHLPGSLETAGIGDPVTVGTKWTGSIFDKSWFTSPAYAPYREPGDIKVPFWLQPETHYKGAAWYQRDIEIPGAWAGRRVLLSLERPHWKTTVWLDGSEIGSNDSLSCAHEYDLGPPATPAAHVLTIRIDNTYAPEIGENSHSISDHTQGNWNGIVGRIELRTTATAWIDDLQVTALPVSREFQIRGRVAHWEGVPMPTEVKLHPNTYCGLSGDRLTTPVGSDGTFSVKAALGEGVDTWDEFSPMVFSITAALPGGESRTVQFGVREISADGHQLLINGRKLFLRGTLDCAAYPLTGHPPMDVATWEQTLGVIKAHGLNHVRFHSWCPPEAAFVAADKLGVYLQVEVASWPGQGATIGDGAPVDAWLERETERIQKTYGNHPSFILLCACNEPHGPHHTTWLGGWVDRRKAQDPRRLYTAGAGWPEIPANEYHIRSEPRIQQWGDGLKSRINSAPPETRTDYREFINARTVPVVSHEIGQWCAYPDLDEIGKYTGYLKARNFEIFRDTLTDRALLPQAHDFLIASGRLQALCYKEDIESALRTPGMGGFQLLGLSDFPGQGTALVGVLNTFWENKGYINAAEFRRFACETVPLARLDRRVFTTNESLVADLELAHFGAAPITMTTHWSLRDDKGHAVASGTFHRATYPVGNGTPLGHVAIRLARIPAAARYKLVVELEGTKFANDWDVWVYPSKVDSPKNASEILVTHSFDAEAEAALASGRSVFLMLPPANVRDYPARPVALGFSSIFWNTAWTHGQAPHTLGIVCDPKNPALAEFPTDGFSNWQWWYPIHDAAAMVLDGLPQELRPIVQVVDDWFTNHKLGLVFEAQVGGGRLLVSSIDFGDATADPVRRQLRASLMDYIASPRFAPTVAITQDQVRSLIVERP